MPWTNGKQFVNVDNPVKDYEGCVGHPTCWTPLSQNCAASIQVFEVFDTCQMGAVKHIKQQIKSRKIVGEWVLASWASNRPRKHSQGLSLTHSRSSHHQTNGAAITTCCEILALVTDQSVPNNVCALLNCICTLNCCILTIMKM